MTNTITHVATITDYKFVWNKEDEDIVAIYTLLPEETADGRKWKLETQVPYLVLREFVGQIMQKQLIARLEGMTGNETLNALR